MWWKKKWKNSSLLHLTSSRHLIRLQSSFRSKCWCHMSTYLHLQPFFLWRADTYQANLMTSLSLHNWRRTNLILTTQVTSDPYQTSLSSKYLECLICMRSNVHLKHTVGAVCVSSEPLNGNGARQCFVQHHHGRRDDVSLLALLDLSAAFNTVDKDSVATCMYKQRYR